MTVVFVTGPFAGLFTSFVSCAEAVCVVRFRLNKVRLVGGDATIVDRCL